MSDDDNYSWLDEHSSDPNVRPTEPEEPTLAPLPPMAEAPTSPPVPPPSPGSVPPMSGRRNPGGADPLAEKLLAGQPPRKGGRLSRLGTRDKLKLGAIVLVIGAAAVYANFIGPDTSSIGGLDIGECFEAPDGRVKRVTMQDCALPHEGQVVAEANGLRDDSQQKCVEAFDALDPLRIATLPPDASFVVLNATISHRCVVISPSGQITQSLTGP